MIHSIIPIISLSLLLIALNWLDLYLTDKVLMHGGREINPLMKNPKYRIFIKIIVIAIFISISFINLQFLIGINILMLGVCAWNATQLLKQLNK
jgi:hypothetical protein